jgi:hypothetical protein
MNQQTQRASIRAATPEHPWYVVQVQELKHNTLRGDTYWVTRLVRQYRLRAHAEALALRYGWDGTFH